MNGLINLLTDFWKVIQAESGVAAVWLAAAWTHLQVMVVSLRAWVVREAPLLWHGQLKESTGGASDVLRSGTESVVGWLTGVVGVLPVLWLAILLAAAIGAWTGLLVQTLLTWLAARRAWSGRLGRSIPGAASPPGSAPGADRRIALRVGGALRPLIPAGWLSFLRRRLQSAGMATTLEFFIGQWAVLLASWYLLVTALHMLVHLPPLLSTLALTVAFLGPFLQLSHQEGQRSRRIRIEFPFLIDFITMTVEAGLSLDAGLARAGQKLPGPLGEEARRYVQNLGRGMSRKEALLAFGEGVGLPEAREFIHVLIQGVSLGVPLAGVLRHQAWQIREDLRLQAEEAAEKIPVKLLFPLVVFIFPTIFLVVMGPAVVWIVEYGFR